MNDSDASERVDARGDDPGLHDMRLSAEALLKKHPGLPHDVAQTVAMIRALRCGLGCPATIEPPTPENRERVERWFPMFEQLMPPVEDRDVIGLIVVRLASELIERGVLSSENGELARLRALTLAVAVAPDRMERAGFLNPPAARPGVNANAQLHQVEGMHVAARWSAWALSVLDPNREARTERETLVRGLARMRCLRPVANESAAFKRAAKLLNEWCLAKHSVRSNAEPDDLMQDCWLLPPAKLLDKKILSLGKDGQLVYDPKRLRDIDRTTAYAATGRRKNPKSGAPVSTEAPAGEAEDGVVSDQIPGREPDPAKQASQVESAVNAAKTVNLLRKECGPRPAAFKAAIVRLTEKEAKHSRESLALRFNTTVDKIRGAEDKAAQFLAGFRDRHAS